MITKRVIFQSMDLVHPLTLIGSLLVACVLWVVVPKIAMLLDRFPKLIQPPPKTIYPTPSCKTATAFVKSPYNDDILRYPTMDTSPMKPPISVKENHNQFQRKPNPSPDKMLYHNVVKMDDTEVEVQEPFMIILPPTPPKRTKPKNASPKTQIQPIIHKESHTAPPIPEPKGIEMTKLTEPVFEELDQLSLEAKEMLNCLTFRPLNTKYTAPKIMSELEQKWDATAQRIDAIAAEEERKRRQAEIERQEAIRRAEEARLFAIQAEKERETARKRAQEEREAREREAADQARIQHEAEEAARLQNAAPLKASPGEPRPKKSLEELYNWAQEVINKHDMKLHVSKMDPELLATKRQPIKAFLNQVRPTTEVRNDNVSPPVS